MTKKINKILKRRCGGVDITSPPDWNMPDIRYGLTEQEERAVELLRDLDPAQLNSVSIVVWAIKKAGRK